MEYIIAYRFRLEKLLERGEDFANRLLNALDTDMFVALVDTAARLAKDCSVRAVVLSGGAEAVLDVVSALRADGHKTKRLTVSHAFHSPLMEVAKRGLREHLASVDFHAPRFPVVSNVTAEPVDDTETARRLLVEQLTSPVRWTASMRTLLDRGVQRFIELGSGSVLAGLLKRIERSAESRSVGGADDARVEWDLTNERGTRVAPGVSTGRAGCAVRRSRSVPMAPSALPRKSEARDPMSCVISSRSSCGRSTCRCWAHAARPDGTRSSNSRVAITGIPMACW